MTERTEWTGRIVSVRFVAPTFGRNRENPPSLGHIRTFVNLCEGLPDETSVRIDKGSLGEDGRHNVVFSLRIVEREEAS